MEKINNSTIRGKINITRPVKSLIYNLQELACQIKKILLNYLSKKIFFEKDKAPVSSKGLNNKERSFL